MKMTSKASTASSELPIAPDPASRVAPSSTRIAGKNFATPAKVGPAATSTPVGKASASTPPPATRTSVLGAEPLQYSPLSPRHAHHVVHQLRESAKRRTRTSQRSAVAQHKSPARNGSPRAGASNWAPSTVSGGGDANASPRRSTSSRFKPKTPTVYKFDRFIPNRAGMDMQSSHYHLSQSSSDEDSATGSRNGDSKTPSRQRPLDAAALAYQSEVARACGVSINKRILAFKLEPPTTTSANPLKTLWKGARPTQPPANRRRIPTLPEKVLDAPGLADDYYLNLLDWSCGNVMGVGLDKSVFVWNGTSGAVGELARPEGVRLSNSEEPEPDQVSSVGFTPDGHHLAVGLGSGDCQVWDVESQTLLRTMRGHVSRVGVLSWDQRHLVSSGSRSGRIFHHDVRVRDHKVGEIAAHTAEVCGLQWRPDGGALASGGNDNLVNVYDARSSVPKMTKANHTSAVKAVAWCPWQLNLLATGGGSHDRQIHFWNPSTSALLSSIDTGSQVTSILWSRDYRELLSTHGYPDNQLTIWSYPSLARVADLPGHDSRVLYSALSPDGQTVVTGAGDENLKFWRVFERKAKKAGASGIGGTTASGPKDDQMEDLVKVTKRMAIR
ncbi:ubiquitin-protein transferase activating protein [Irineochytrium annulatum]|nr:ubiquitin-protein transferase activating protein [Irineochytrium annulatum]